jgi:hypothetical protein
MRAHTGSGPQTARRTSDVRERRDWEQQQTAKEQPSRDLDQRMQAYREQRDRDAADEARRITEGNERYRQAVESEKQVIAQRTQARLLAAMFEQHSATDAERTKVSRLVEQRPLEQRTIEVYEVTLLRLRGELAGNIADSQPDWRDSLRREDA